MDEQRKAYTQYNALAVDRWVDEGWEWGRPISRAEYKRAQAGDWQVVLTPQKPVPREWFGELKGKRVLGLASGGGQQMPVFAALGAVCTVFDLSDAQLETERQVAKREGYEIDIVKGDMTRPLPFGDDRFDLIFHPVSNVYIRDVQPLWQECYRVLKKGGVLLAGLDNGINFLFDDDSLLVQFPLPHDPLLDPDWEQKIPPDGSLQFSHRIEEQLGGQLAAGFVLTSIFEDSNSTGPLAAFRVPCYYASRAVKPFRPAQLLEENNE